MQTNLIYLYKNKTEVQLSDGFSDRRNRIVYASDLVIHKNVDNVLHFQFKNPDQKRINIGNKEVTFVMFDDRNKYNTVLIELPMVVLDAITGKTSLTIPEQYLHSVEFGKYEYSVRVHDANGTTESAYVDDNYGVRGVIDVRKGSAPRFRPSDILTFNLSTNMTDVVGEITSLQQNNGLHTAIVKFDEMEPFTGTLEVHGTLDNITQQTGVNFFEIMSLDMVDQTENITLNFNGVFSGVRFFQGVSTGEINQIHYRF